MSYKEMVMDLKQEKKDIIFIKNGAFYIAIGNDAIVLNQILQLKCTCFSKGICKVGVPIASIDKYTSKLKESNYNYSVYELKEDKETEELKLNIIQTNQNGINNIETRRNLQCSKCSKCKFPQDKYDKALKNYINDKVGKQ